VAKANVKREKKISNVRHSTVFLTLDVAALVCPSFFSLAKLPNLRGGEAD